MYWLHFFLCKEHPFCKQNYKDYVPNIVWYKKHYFYHRYEFFLGQIQNQHKFKMIQLVA